MRCAGPFLASPYDTKVARDVRVPFSTSACDISTSLLSNHCLLASSVCPGTKLACATSKRSSVTLCRTAPIRLNTFRFRATTYINVLKTFMNHMVRSRGGSSFSKPRTRPCASPKLLLLRLAYQDPIRRCHGIPCFAGAEIEYRT